MRHVELNIYSIFSGVENTNLAEDLLKSMETYFIDRNWTDTLEKIFDTTKANVNNSDESPSSNGMKIKIQLR